MMLSDYKTVGENLYQRRKELGMTQYEVAEHAGISDRTYADIERGSVNMRIGTFLQICDALKTTPNDILLRDETKYSEAEQFELLKRIKDCQPSEQDTILSIIATYLNSINKAI